VREYRPGSDVVAEKTQPMASTKTLSLDYGRSISSDVYREKELTGFGLVLVRDDSPGFSWEWFERERSDVFRKVRGGGKARVSVAKSDKFQELVAVEFLDDITLQCTDDQTGTTHEVHVRKGSLWIPRGNAERRERWAIWRVAALLPGLQGRHAHPDHERELALRCAKTRSNRLDVFQLEHRRPPSLQHAAANPASLSHTTHQFHVACFT
jgi:hypothetical protein